MPRLPNLSLRIRLLLLVLLAIVPLLGLVLYNAAQQRQYDLSTASQRAETAASLAATSVSQRLQGQRQLLVTLAQLPVVAAGDAAGDAAGCASAARAIQGSVGQYTNVGAARPNGDIFCSALALTQTTNVAGRSWFQQAVASGGFALGDYQFSAATGRPVVVGAYPVRAAGGALQAVVFAAMDLTQFDSLAQGVALPDNSTVDVIDRGGTILSRYPNPANWVGQNLPDNPLIKGILSHDSGSAQMAGLDGVQRLYGFAAISDPVPGLHIAVGIPVDQAYAEVNAGLARSLIGLALVTIVVLAAARLAADAFVLGPVASLVNATRRLAAGDRAARYGGPYQAGELDELAAGFDGLAAAIQQREAELDRTNRILKTLNECNQALVRSTDEHSLLEAICRNIVTFGGYPLAWVELASDQTGDTARNAILAATAATAAAPSTTLSQPEAPPPTGGPPPTGAPPPPGGPSTAAMQTGQPSVMPADAAGTPAAWREHAQRAGYRVLLALPLMLAGQTLGALCISTTQAAGFETSETQLLGELSGDLAYGLSALRTREARARAEAQLAQNARRWRALAELDQKLGGAGPRYQALLDELAEGTSELVGDATIVNLLSGDGQSLSVAALHHPDPEARAILQTLVSYEPRLVSGQGAQRVVTTGEPQHIAQVPQDALRAAVPAAYLAYVDRFGVHSLLTVAMRAQGKVIGTLMAARGVPGRPYSDDERDFLQSIADQAALAISNARLYDQIEAANAELERRVAERTAALELEVARHAQAQAEIEDLYNSAPCGYHSLDAQGIFVRVNDYETQLFGYAREALIGQRTLADILTPASREVFAQAFHSFLETGWVHNLELEVCRSDGSRLPVLISATAVRDEAGRFIMTRSTLLDIADRKEAEARIQALNDSLRQRAAELEVINRELEAFSYSVSHDLRAPLRAIDGFSLALLEDYAPQLPPGAQGYLQRVRAAAQRMAGLIDDLINLSRVTRSELRLEPVDLSLQAQNIAAELARSEPERQVEFVIAPGLTARGDSRLLGLVLSNLLGNAWKFTQRREQARIEFGASGGADRPVFFVRDNGAGFDMAYVQRLFGAFQRLHDQNDYPGSGIGLATVQRIVHRHGGQVWAEGQLGQGAAFYFTIGQSYDRENHPAG